MSSEAYQSVIDALRTKKRMCRHELIETTGLPFNVVRNALQSLQHSHAVMRVEGLDATDKVYSLTDESLLIPQPQDGERRVPVLFGLDESTAIDRVLLIKRLKGRLIESYHPALDLIMSDYQKGLDFLESFREGPEEPL